MPTPDYADAAVADLLDELVSGSTTLALGANLFTGPPRPHSTRGRQTLVPIGPVVFCLATGGPAPQEYLGVGKGLRFENVQVTVRERPERYADGLALARACLDALHKQVPSGFIDTRVRESQPVWIGADDNGCHLFVLNVEARVVRDDA